METMTLVVGPDGRVKIPGTEAGQTVTIQLEPAKRHKARSLSPEERERIIQEQLEDSRRTRESADPEWLHLDHGEWLYGPDGLPR
jgi:hypothetical protein